MPEPEHSLIVVRLTPRASRDEIGDWKDGALLVRVTAPPVEGRANEALRRLLASRLSVAPSSISVVGGQTSRVKRVRVEGLSLEESRRLLGG